MKPVSLDEINTLRHAIQYFQDCYLVSSIGALAKSSNGRRFLAENITHSGNGFRIKLNVDKKSKDYFVSEKEINNLVYMDEYLNPLPINPSFPHNPIIKAVEVAMNKLLKEHPSKKPWICRLAKCNEKFEFNMPSIFLEIFTGKKPVKLNENSINFNLKSRETDAIDIFNKISDDSDSSFVVGTSFGVSRGLKNTHCYSVQKTDKNQKTIEFFDHRQQKTIKLTYQDAIKNLKLIAGYFSKDLL